MLLCHDWRIDPANRKLANIYGLLSNIVAIDPPDPPLIYPEICVFLALSDCYGGGTGKISCIHEETGQTAFASRNHKFQFGSDPLAVIMASFRIRDCVFPYRGMYTVQFWYASELVAERPLRVR
jgi:hypothetical protein